MEAEENKPKKESFESLSKDEQMEYLEKGIVFGDHKLKKKRKTNG